MDGFKSSDNICVFAGTNRVDVLDPALLRAGRFDRHIAVDKPDLRGRKAIAKIYLSKVVIDGDVDEKSYVIPYGARIRVQEGDEVKAGDRILFAKWSGTEVKLNGEDRLIIKESEILGVIEE